MEDESKKDKELENIEQKVADLKIEENKPKEEESKDNKDENKKPKEEEPKDNKEGEKPKEGDNQKEGQHYSLDELDELFAKLGFFGNFLVDKSGPKHEDKYKEVIDGLKEGKFKNITFLTGAGISTAAGIPDFRSTGGLFAQLKEKYGLSTYEEFFELETFLKSPTYFYEFCKNNQLLDKKPTKSHLFQSFLMNKKKLTKLIYTQNIDGLELKAGIPSDKVIFAHGNFNEAACPGCGKEYAIEKFKEYVDKDEILYCEDCKKPVKVKVVFYGEKLPTNFFNSFDVVKSCDLCFIMGTSLKVGPFNTLATLPPLDAWRVLINYEKVGVQMGLRYDDEYKKDLFIPGSIDENIMKIVKEVGWEKEFDDYCKEIMDKLK